jgi:hypothetical protein
MGIGTVDQPANRGGGGYQHGRENFYCRWCDSFTSVPVKAPAPTKCSTPEWRRPYGFGASVQR